ncbi:hypothetical protein MMC34_008539 [Xylographa carneopallida]|nr:hypothetical protein [Xylographa carneopallida]
MRVLLSVLVSAALAVVASAQTAQPAALSIANASDAAGVNYALTIERLDSTFWSCYLSSYTLANQPYCAYMPANYSQFGEADFAAAGYNSTVWQAVNLIAAEELTHAALLNITVQALGYAPVQPCQYVYPNITSVANYLAQGLKFETTGTAAYAGSLNGLSNPALVQAAASIASVEARHAGYLSALLNQQPFASSGFNDAYNSSYVAQLITPYYADPTCLAQTVLPMVRPFGTTNSAANQQNASVFTGKQSAAYGVSYTAAAQANDVLTLNYALVLEELEATFYNNASTAFTPADFTAAGLSSSVASYLAIIAANENTHVAVLSTLIAAYGGVPVQNCSYNFSALGFDAFSSVANYLKFASTVEGVGVMAYDGAANTLTDTYLLQAAATIDMIEARHVAFINSLLYSANTSQAFPTATDSPMTPAQVFALVTGAGIITSCGNQSINFPASVYPVPAAAAAAGGSSGSSSSSSSTATVIPVNATSSTGSAVLGSSSSAASATATASSSTAQSGNSSNGASTAKSAQLALSLLAAVGFYVLAL